MTRITNSIHLNRTASLIYQAALVVLLGAALTFSAVAQTSPPPIGGFIYFQRSNGMATQVADPLTACQSAYNGQGNGFYNFTFPTTGTNYASDYRMGMTSSGYDGVTCYYRNTGSQDNSSDHYLGSGEFLYGCPDGYTSENLICKVDPDRDVTPPCDSASTTSVGDPIDISSASVKESVTDFETVSFQPIRLRRIYNSRGRPGRLLGNSRWHFDFEYELDTSSNGANFYTPQGEHYVFSVDSNGKYTVQNNEGPISLILDQYGYYDITLSDGTIVVFTPSSTQNLVRYITRNDGLTENFYYVGPNSDQLSSLSSSSGVIAFTPDANTASNVISATINNYYQVNYSYTSASGSSSTYSKLLSQANRLQNGTAVDNVQYVYENTTYPYLLTGVFDERGIRVSTWTYDNTARALSSTEAGSLNQTIITYNDTLKTRTVSNSLNKQFTYNLQAAKGLMHISNSSSAKTTSTLASTTSSTYDSNQNLATQTDEEGRITAYSRDSNGRPTQITYGSGSAASAAQTVVYQQNSSLPSSVSVPGLTTSYMYNSYGQVTQVTQTDTTSQTVPFSTSGRTRTWTYTYGRGSSGFEGPLVNGLLLSVDGPLSGTGDTVTYTYNQSNYLKTITDEVGHVTTVTAWNSLGAPTSITNMNGVVTTYTYDGRGRVTSITINPGSSQTQWSFTYTAAGDVATVTEPSGAAYTMTWDNARRMTQIANNLGETISYARDTMGDVTGKTIVAADGKTVMFQVTNTFDELGRLIKQVGGENATWSYAYDRTSLQTGTTDPRGKALAYGYDAVSRLVKETERDGGVVAHAYNGKSEETTYTDPRSLTTTYVRNGFGDIIQETSPDRGTTVYDYDARGLVISRKDARAKQTSYAYDNAGRLTSVTYPATAALNVAYTYDGSAAGPNGTGHLTHVQDAAGTTDYTYDVVGRISGETRTFGSTAYTTTYTYDQAGTGKLIFLTLPGGQMLNYSYDALGRISGIGIGSGYSGPFTNVVSNLSYFPYGPLREIDFNNGVVRYENDDLEYKLDGLFLTKGSTTLVTRYHSFGDHLNLLELNNDSVDPTKTQTFGYDNAQRLTSAAASGTYGSLGWTYDLVGNRLTEARRPSGSSTTTTSTFTYPTTSNLLSNVKQGSTVKRAFVYDAAGNTTKDTRGSTAYAYAINDGGRISQLTIGSTVTAKYTYDAKDRLSVRQTLNMSPAGTTQMLYDVWDHLLAETDGAGHVVKQYIWVGDEPVAVLDGTANPASPVLYYVHADHLQRPELMTNASGSVVWTAYYEPFGTVSSITGSLTENQRFPGQWFELEAGLAYNWHRHYDSTLGRYTTPDPLGPYLSPQASTVPTILGTAVDSGSGPTLTGVSAPPATPAIDPGTYPAGALSLAGVGQPTFGLAPQTPPANATLGPRDGPSLFGYARQDPSIQTDKNGLGTPTTGDPWGMWISPSGNTCRFFDANGNADYDIDIPGHHFPMEWHPWDNGRRGKAVPF